MRAEWVRWIYFLLCVKGTMSQCFRPLLCDTFCLAPCDEAQKVWALLKVLLGLWKCPNIFFVNFCNSKKTLFFSQKVAELFWVGFLPKSSATTTVWKLRCTVLAKLPVHVLYATTNICIFHLFGIIIFGENLIFFAEPLYLPQLPGSRGGSAQLPQVQVHGTLFTRCQNIVQFLQLAHRYCQPIIIIIFLWRSLLTAHARSKPPLQGSD